MPLALRLKTDRKIKSKKCGFGRHPILLCYRRFCTDKFIGEFDVAAVYRVDND